MKLFSRRSNLSLLAELAIALVRGYQHAISPLFPPSCRFYPTCSNYSIEAFHTHGFIKGLQLSAWRILRCNPFSRGGYDPVTPVRDPLERKI